MSPTIPSARLTLKYPIYASDFDPLNNDFLYVGGGGGEGRSGVKNKITLIDTSKRHELLEVIDVELSANEDSVQSMVVAQSTGDSAVVFAGINSSAADQERGVNEHLRSFNLRYPRRQSKEKDSQSEAAKANAFSTITPLSKAALFTPSTAKVKETYQRVLRLTKSSSEQSRLGVLATGLAPEGEVLVFDATNSKPDRRDIRQRINLGPKKEADDADVTTIPGSGYLITYCCGPEIFLSKLTTNKTDPVKEPVSIYETPRASPASSSRLKFRFIRFLTPKLLIGIVNIPSWGGAELLLLEVDSKAMSSTVLLRKTLPKRMKAATTFAVCSLPSPDNGGHMQHVLAIGGQDISLTILTLDHKPDELRNLVFRQHSQHRDLHPIQMTSLAISNFIQPTNPIKAAAQYLKLVSTSMSSTVVVQTLPLTPYPSAVGKRKASDAPVRYTLMPPKPVKGQTPLGLSALIAIILVALSAFLLQAVIEIRGATPEILGAKGWLSDSLREKIALPWMFDEYFETDSSSSIQSQASEAYEYVKDSIPDTEDVREAAEEAASQVREAVDEVGNQARNAADQVKSTVHHYHSQIRDVLSYRAEHLATKLTGDDDDEDEGDDDDDTPLFRNIYSSNHGDEIQTEATESEVPQTGTVVIKDVGPGHDHELRHELHHSEADLSKQGNLRRWEQLGARERRSWLRKLEDAGVWTVEEGESVLKGIFFSELAGAVAGAVRG